MAGGRVKRPDAPLRVPQNAPHGRGRVKRPDAPLRVPQNAPHGRGVGEKTRRAPQNGGVSGTHRGASPTKDYQH